MIIEEASVGSVKTDELRNMFKMDREERLYNVSMADIEPKALAVLLREFSEAEAKGLVGRFFRSYPELRKWKRGVKGKKII